MSDLNRQPAVAPVETQPPVHTDSTHSTTDSTTTGTNALLFRDNDLMGGITSINQNMQKSPVDLPTLEFTDSETEQTISFEPPPQGTDQNTPVRDGGPQQPLPERQQPTNQQIAQMITNLNSDSFHVRDRATRDVIAAGPAALPQLLQALGSDTTPLEVRRRSEGAVRSITDRMSTEQLLSMRDPANRQQAIRDGVTAPLTADQTRAVDTALANAARAGLETRLSNPEWLNNLNIGYKGKFGDFSRTPTEASVREFDRMATPEGRRQATQRLGELTQILSSEHISNEERETISRQIGEIARVTSPQFIADGRVNARTNLADYLSQTGGNPDRISALMLEAHQLSDRPAPNPNAQQQPGFNFQRDIRAQVRQDIVRMGLDQNPAFMQRFGTQAGQAEVQAIQGIRAQVEEDRRAVQEQLQRGGGK